jgi:hypothetical protein
MVPPMNGPFRSVENPVNRLQIAERKEGLEPVLIFPPRDFSCHAYQYCSAGLLSGLACSLHSRQTHVPETGKSETTFENIEHIYDWARGFIAVFTFELRSCSVEELDM